MCPYLTQCTGSLRNEVVCDMFIDDHQKCPHFYEARDEFRKYIHNNQKEKEANDKRKK